jgi:hypothetical protein
MVGETHEPIHHVFKDDMGDAESTPNLKNLADALKSKFSKPLFMGARAFVHAAKKRDALFIYAFPTTNVGSQQHEIFLNTNITKMCLKINVLTLY